MAGVLCVTSSKLLLPHKRLRGPVSLHITRFLCSFSAPAVRSWVWGARSHSTFQVLGELLLLHPDTGVRPGQQVARDPGSPSLLVKFLSESLAFLILSKLAADPAVGKPRRLVYSICILRGVPVHSRTWWCLLCFAGGRASQGSSNASLRTALSFFLSFFFRATPAAHGGSQARGRIRATAADLHRSHSHAGSEPHLRPTPQLTATPDP